MSDIIDDMSCEDIEQFTKDMHENIDMGTCKGCIAYENLRGPTLSDECVRCWKEKAK